MTIYDSKLAVMCFSLPERKIRQEFDRAESALVAHEDEK